MAGIEEQLVHSSKNGKEVFKEMDFGFQILHQMFALIAIMMVFRG